MLYIYEYYIKRSFYVNICATWADFEVIEWTVISQRYREEHLWGVATLAHRDGSETQQHVPCITKHVICGLACDQMQNKAPPAPFTCVPNTIICQKSVNNGKINNLIRPYFKAR